jgi:hypothetical protein
MGIAAALIGLREQPQNDDQSLTSCMSIPCADHDHAVRSNFPNFCRPHICIIYIMASFTEGSNSSLSIAQLGHLNKHPNTRPQPPLLLSKLDYLSSTETIKVFTTRCTTLQ